MAAKKNEHVEKLAKSGNGSYFQGTRLVDDFYEYKWLEQKVQSTGRSIEFNLYFWEDWPSELKLEKYHLGHITCISYSRRGILLVLHCSLNYVVVYSITKRL